MNARDDDLEQVLRPWMHRHAPDAPNELVLRIYGEIETMSEHAPSRSWLSRFAALPATAWMATLAALAVVAVAGGVLFANFFGVPTGTQPTPTPTTSPSAGNPTALADALDAAWNSGDAQKAASLYASPPIVRFMIDGSQLQHGWYSPDGPGNLGVNPALTAWHSKGTVITRTGNVLAQGSFAAFPVTWTSSDGTFNGVEVIRIAADGLVSEQFLLGDPTSVSGTAPSGDPARLVDSLLSAQNSSDGATAGTLFAATAQGIVIHDGDVVNTVPDGAHFATSITNGYACCETRTGNVQAQGPFLVFPMTTASPTGTLGGEGFQVFELTSDGQIGWIWEIASVTAQPSGAPAGSGG